MGMVPIVLALAGFVLLWSMLTYSSLQTKFKQGKHLKAEAKRLYEQRNALYTLALPQTSKPSFEEADLASHKEMIREISQFVLQHEQEANSTELQQLSQLNNDFKEVYSAFLNQSHGYNQLIAERPISFLATICKMQALS